MTERKPMFYCVLCGLCYNERGEAWGLFSDHKWVESFRWGRVPKGLCRDCYGKYSVMAKGAKNVENRMDR